MKKVMVVDDAETIRLGIRKALEMDGFNVTEAQNGSEALSFLKNNLVDCMVTDLNMPVMNGLQLVEEVRALPGYRFVPIIMLSSENKDDYYAEAKSNGVSTWLEKPCEPVKLTKLVRAMTF